jgi:hypothetical protein
VTPITYTRNCREISSLMLGYPSPPPESISRRPRKRCEQPTCVAVEMEDDAAQSSSRRAPAAHNVLVSLATRGV